MADIRHRVGINAPVPAVYEALATAEGLSRWWTTNVEGRSQVGDMLIFRFGRPEPSAIMAVTDLVPQRRVVWRCVEGPDDWRDTTLTFEIKPNGDETVVLFTHGGWREPVEFFHHCSTAWGYYLLSLKHAVEGGPATPWPDNELISTWG